MRRCRSRCLTSACSGIPCRCCRLGAGVPRARLAANENRQFVFGGGNSTGCESNALGCLAHVLCLLAVDSIPCACVSCMHTHIYQDVACPYFGDPRHPPDTLFLVAESDFRLCGAHCLPNWLDDVSERFAHSDVQPMDIAGEQVTTSEEEEGETGGAPRPPPFRLSLIHISEPTRPY